MKNFKKHTILFLAICTLFASCKDDDKNTPTLIVPDTYESSNYTANVTAEAKVIEALSAMTVSLNEAEKKAQKSTVSAISYPSALSSVTVGDYSTLVSEWLVELVAAANDDDAFQNPGVDGSPTTGEQGGLLGSRLLDENGLELEQMIQKGSFGAALYNHAVSLISTGDLTDAATIDRLIEIHGTDASFNPEETVAAATYSRRRSYQSTLKGPFYDIQKAMITAKAAIEAGSAFNSKRDQALADYLLAWEKSNFATVIYYCNTTKVQLRDAAGDDEALGDAMHAYAEAVGFVHGFRGISKKKIADAQIDRILALLLAKAGEKPTSFQFLNNATLLANLEQIIDDIKAIYGFSDSEIEDFLKNDPS